VVKAFSQNIEDKNVSLRDTQIVKMRPQLFYQSCKRKACKMPPNLTAKSFIFGHINRENLSKTFSANLEGGKFPKWI